MFKNRYAWLSCEFTSASPTYSFILLPQPCPGRSCMLHLWTSVSSSTTDRSCVTASGSRISVIFFLASSWSFCQQFNCRLISLTKIHIVKYANISADALCSASRVAGPRRRASIRSGTRGLVPVYIPSHFTSIGPRSQTISFRMHSCVHPGHFSWWLETTWRIWGEFGDTVGSRWKCF
jgi:hypothetical protein